ncbi:beta-galactosidase-like [Dermacentor andersoni]|uniref:beta-galactosidase-like n=1 Tax=Dermacentor andersoni TaxID=34620 RepID=UPI002416D969|nr:beta-galactosidase-like [Dermacentor andersoni]
MPNFGCAVLLQDNSVETAMCEQCSPSRARARTRRGDVRAALLCVCANFLLNHVIQCSEGRSLVVDHTRAIFLKDGQPFRFLAGEMHYFRVPKAYWKDRLYKIKMAGLNAVAFYIEWSGHEPEPGVHNFRDEYDLDAFLKEIKEQGLLAIARPGPYICGERDNGGLPYWLLRENPNMIYRSSHASFVAAVDRWFAKLLPMLVPHLYRNGGPIFAVQVENEYGHYFLCDLGYMRHLITVMETHMGTDVVYYRTDFPVGIYYSCDWVRDILVAGNIPSGYDVATVFSIMQRANPKPAPMVVPEFYTGWMDHWGWSHFHETKDSILDPFKRMMAHNASVTFYMFVGGTNFGFKSAKANSYPLTTSYDYEAPVAEDGDMRPIYYDIRHLATNYLGHVPSGEMPQNTTKLNVGLVKVNEHISLEEVMNHFRSKEWLKLKQSVDPLTFESMRHDYGFLIYRTTVNLDTQGTAWLFLPKLNDRAYVRVGYKQFIFYNHMVSYGMPKLFEKIPVKKGDSLSILVENMGRECYGYTNHNVKGLTEVRLGSYVLKNWTIEAVPINTNRDINEILRIVRRQGDGSVPGFFHGTFTLKQGQNPADTFLNPSGWIKGFAFINGFNLGRYWPAAGPQVTLYVPAPYIKPHPEENQLLLFETEGAPANRFVKLVDKPLLDADIFNPSP